MHLQVPLTLSEVGRRLRLLQSYEEKRESQPEGVSLTEGISLGQVPEGEAPNILSAKFLNKASRLDLLSAAWALANWRYFHTRSCIFSISLTFDVAKFPV